jgi:hypothetical protein
VDFLETSSDRTFTDFLFNNFMACTNPRTRQDKLRRLACTHITSGTWGAPSQGWLGLGVCRILAIVLLRPIVVLADTNPPLRDCESGLLRMGMMTRASLLASPLQRRCPPPHLAAALAPLLLGAESHVLTTGPPPHLLPPPAVPLPLAALAPTAALEPAPLTCTPISAQAPAPPALTSARPSKSNPQ